MRKHAYLIISHHEPEILRLLVNALDDERNDIYIHFDKKYKVHPNLEVKYSKLYILEKRLDVRWGDCSQIKAELLLFESAYRNFSYDYYHLLSGVDFPIKSQNYIHSFFNENNGKQFIGFSQGDLVEEIDRKIRRYHLFPKEFRNGNFITGLFCKAIRKLFLKIQICFDLKRHKNVNFKKGPNWVSITSEFVEFLLLKKKEIIKMYSFTFCADEIYKQTICWSSSFRDCVYDLSNPLNSSKRMIRWVDNNLIDWGEEDIDYLLESSGLFARKFSSENIEAIRTILQKIKDH